MDSDDNASDKPDSAGAHSVRSQLIVVSPREDAESETTTGGTDQPEHFVFTNPTAMDDRDG